MLGSDEFSNPLLSHDEYKALPGIKTPRRARWMHTGSFRNSTARAQESGVELGEAALHTRHSPLDCYTVWDGDDVSRPTFSFNASEKHIDCISSRAV